jgi:hypothetical protein
MTVDTSKPSKPTTAKVAEPKVKVLQVNPDTFDLICRSLYNFSCELNAMARDLNEMKIAFVQVGSTLAAMGVDLRAVVAAHQGLAFKQEQAPTVDLDTLAKRLPPLDSDEFPRMLRQQKA